MLVPISATLALVLSALPAHANEPTTPDTEALPETEVSKVERGDGYVAVYPESSAPLDGDGDYLTVEGIDDDTLVIMADSEGNLPMGLEAEEVHEVSTYIEQQGIAPPSSSAEMADVLDEVGIDSSAVTKQSQTKSDASIQAGGCNGFSAWAGSWGPVYTSNYSVTGSSGYRLTYSASPAAGWTQQLVTARGLGYIVTGTTNRVERRWYSLGSAYTGSTLYQSVSWGNVASYPEFQARSVSLTATGQWCH